MDSISLDINNELYHKFELMCEKLGTTPVEEIETFILSVLEDDKEITEEYRQKLDNIRKGKFIKINNFAEHFGL